MRGAGGVGIRKRDQNIHRVDAGAGDNPVRLKRRALGGDPHTSVHFELGLLSLHAHDSVVPEVRTEVKIVLEVEFALGVHLVGAVDVNATHRDAPHLIVLVGVAVNSAAVEIESALNLEFGGIQFVVCSHPTRQDTSVVKRLHVGLLFNGHAAGIRVHPAVGDVNVRNPKGIQTARNQPKLGARRQEIESVLTGVCAGHSRFDTASFFE